MSIGAGPIQSAFPYGFANGLTVRGLPVEQTYPGRSFWVYNGTQLAPGGRGGSDGNRGSFESPFASIAGALKQCLAGRGDIIWVKPGHVEPVITAAGGLNLNVAGVQIIGLGNGAARPSISFSTANTASITVTAAQMSLVNFLIDCTGFAAISTPVNVAAADFYFGGNDVVLANATNQAVVGVAGAPAADRLIIDNNRFRGSANAGNAAAISLVGGDSIQVTNNTMIGSYTATIGGINQPGAASTNLFISGNYIVNATAASTKGIVLVAGTTGLVVNNRVAILSGTAPLTGAAVNSNGNLYSAAVGPTATATPF